MTAPSVIPSEVQAATQLSKWRGQAFHPDAKAWVFPRDPATPLRFSQDDREPMNFKLQIWRQRDAKSRGKLIDYEVRDISPDTSFLEMLDILNENLLQAGRGTRRVRL